MLEGHEDVSNVKCSFLSERAVRIHGMMGFWPFPIESLWRSVDVKVSNGKAKFGAPSRTARFQNGPPREVDRENGHFQKSHQTSHINS